MIKSASANDVIDPTTYKKYIHYAEVVGKPIKQVIDKALNRWMDESGEIILKSYRELAAKQAEKSHKPSNKNAASCVVVMSKRGCPELNEDTPLHLAAVAAGV